MNKLKKLYEDLTINIEQNYPDYILIILIYIGLDILSKIF